MDQSVALARISTALLHPPVSQGAGAFVSTTGVDLQGFLGNVSAVVSSGAVTGSMSLIRLQDSDILAGTYVDITGATATDITTANQTRAIAVDQRSVRRFLKFAATVTTGPIVVGVTLIGYKTYIPS